MTYTILSPDNIEIEPQAKYKSIKQARNAFKNWASRFIAQGYYSSNNGRIRLDDLEESCTITESL